MWQVELSHVDKIVDATRDRRGKHSVVDTLIYALMSLRQTTPPPLYYFSVETTASAEYHYFAIIVGKEDVDGHPIGNPLIRINLMNRFQNKLLVEITEDTTGTLQSVVDGDWDYEEVKGFLCRRLTAAQHEFLVHGGYLPHHERAYQEGMRLFSAITRPSSKVLFKRRPALEKLGVELLPPPITRNGSLKRKWKRSPTLVETGLPSHITGSRIRRIFPSSQQPRTAFAISPPSLPRYSQVVQGSPSVNPSSTSRRRRSPPGKRPSAKRRADHPFLLTTSLRR